MATGALNSKSVAMNCVAVNCLRDALVASAAGALCHSKVEPGDLNILGIIAGRKVEGMEKAIAGFNRILPDQVVRRVAIITGCG